MAIFDPRAALRPAALKLQATRALTKPPKAPAAKIRLRFRKKFGIKDTLF
jgi:hypothetical protein